MKTCTKCREAKPPELFCGGRTAFWCKSCNRAYKAEWRRRNRDKVNANKRRWRAKKRASVPGYSRLATAREKYGLSQERYMEMLAAAKGACEICGNPTEQFHVDHNHTTGDVRGLLCRWCNYGLGNFRDNPQALESAVAYLKKYGSQEMLL